MKTLPLLIKSLTGTFVFLLILFVSAGHITYWQGWLLATLSIISVVLNTVTLNEELAGERSKPGGGTKSWDKTILGISALMLIAIYVVAGLDSGRFHWSPELSRNFYIAGTVLLIWGEITFLAAQRANRFFSNVVRIQTERGHAVCETGPYKVIRHPGYFGMIITSLGIPLILGSLWCIIPSIISIILTLIRTSLEDKTLRNELKGYAHYTSKTRYRLIPYIW